MTHEEHYAWYQGLPMTGPRALPTSQHAAFRQACATRVDRLVATEFQLPTATVSYWRRRYGITVHNKPVRTGARRWGTRQTPVLALLAQHPEGLYSAAMAQRLHCTRENVRQALLALHRRGQVRRGQKRRIVRHRRGATACVMWYVSAAWEEEYVNRPRTY